MLQRPDTADSRKCRTGRNRIVLLVPAVLLISIGTQAMEWWDEIPYMEWPGVRVYELLMDSPWVALSPAGYRQVETPVRGLNTSRQTGYAVRCFYIARLITAKPIREAMLRSISLKGVLVSAKSTTAELIAEQEQERLRIFMKARPNDLRIKGDEHRIIVAVTLRIDERYHSREEDYGQELTNVFLPELMEVSSLATDSGKRVRLSDFHPAGKDRLGVKFYFPRNMADGTPLIAPGDKELRFETRMNGTGVKVTFNLPKMIYHGALEH